MTGGSSTAPELLQLELVVDGPEELRSRLYPDGLLGGVAITGALPGPLGQRCEVCVKVAGLSDRHFTVQGILAWARHQRSATQLPSYGVAFLADDAGARSRLVGYANQALDPEAARAAERLALELPAILEQGSQARTEVLGNVSEGGAFVRTRLLLPTGTRVQLAFRPPGALLKVRLQGHVAWVRSHGEAAGFGIAFEDLEPRHARRLHRLVARLRQARRRR